jgi:hypothetical protein
VATIALLATAAAAANPDVPSFSPDPSNPPIVGERRYRMSAAIRPLLFWIRSRNVGGARIVWRADGEGRRGYELLIGSDPTRAPRRINRWGWVREDQDPAGATMVGLMRRTEEETLQAARSQIAAEGHGGYSFKAIRARVEDGVGRAANTLWRVEKNYTYHELEDVLRVVASPPQAPPNVRQAVLPEGTRPGFLFAVAELVDEGVAAARTPGAALPAGRSLPFTFNAGRYTLRLRDVDRLAAATYGGRRYERLVRMRFESDNLELRTRERFTLVCGTEAPLAGVPVFLEYQPKWWFKADAFLDDAAGF